MKLPRAVLWAALVIPLGLVGISAGGAGQQFSDDFGAHPVREAWAEGSTHGVWSVRYGGYGEVRVVCVGSAGRALRLRPAAAVAPDVTHAALVITRTAYADGSLVADVRTVSQLRAGGQPNPWETAWVVFRYVDDEHFYYLALKTNGWELGKRDPAYPGGQRFLATGSTPVFSPGVWSRVRVDMNAASLSVEVDGATLANTVDAERPLLTGAVGMYTEDAAVEFDSISFFGR